MKKFNTPIRSLQELDIEIFHLQQETARIETRLGHNYRHLKEHFPQLLFASALQRKGKTSFLVMLLGIIMRNEKMQELLQTFADRLADKGMRWANQFFKKKET